jgi:hypothetical protein
MGTHDCYAWVLDKGIPGGSLGNVVYGLLVVLKI